MIQQSIWDRISAIGIPKKGSLLADRANRFANQVNFTLLLVLTVLNFFVIYFFVIVRGDDYNIYGYRLLILQFVLLLNVWLAYKRMFDLVKAILIFAPVFLIILLPVLLKNVQTSGFFYNHFLVVGFSFVPTILLIPGKQKSYYAISVLYFAIILLFLDNLMFWGTDSEEQVKGLINSFRPFYKLVPFSIFIFLQFALLYLRSITSEYETSLLLSNKKLETNIEELEQMQSRLVQSEKMVSLGTMAAGIAHEINNPLNYINGGAMMVGNELKGTENEMAFQGVEMIKDGVRRASEIVQTIKKFSYNGPLSHEPTDVNQLLSDCLVFVNHLLQDEVVVSKKFELKKKVSLNPDQIQQVVINILENAIFALAQTESKEIKIETSSISVNEVSYASIKFYNNGPKISEKDRAQLFDPFFTTKDPGEGTGLGLWICYALIDRHKGMISADNTQQGVIFSILLPLYEHI